MNNDKNSLRGISELCQAVSIILLMLHIYFYYFPVFTRLEWTTPVTSRLLELIVRTGLFDNAYYSKGLALLFLLLSVLASPPRKTPSISGKRNFWLLLVGLGIYIIFISGLSDWNDVSQSRLVWYVMSVFVSWLLILTASARLFREFRLPWSKDDPFGRGQAGFPQEQARISSDYSLHLQAWFTWQGKKRKSWINLINPRRGVLIMGSPGSGKSWFIIEPFIRQLIEKGVAMFIYDFKHDALTKVAWSHFQANRDKYPLNTPFYSINFTDLSRSHRCNILDPSTLNYLSDALDASRTILLSINKTWASRQGDFFVESPINFVAAIIWYLRKYQGGVYCTLPHVIELSEVPYDRLFPLLKGEPEIATLINPFVEAYNNKTMEMLDGQVAGARIPLGRLSSPELYYVLTGNDFTLDINNPKEPKIVVLANNPEKTQTYGAVISLYLNRAFRILPKKDMRKCCIIADEFSSLFANGIENFLAISRGYKIFCYLAIQNIAQLRKSYGREQADVIFNLAGNLLCGQATGDTAKAVSEVIGKIVQERESISINRQDTSISRSTQLDFAVPASKISLLSAGEFVGVLADNPDQQIRHKAFHCRIQNDPAAINEEERAYRKLPENNNITPLDIQNNYIRIKNQIVEIVESEIERIKADPDLAHLLFVKPGATPPAAAPDDKKD